MITVIWLHFLADFLLQSRTVAKNKSSSWKHLGLHVLIYGLPFMFLGWKYAIVNALLHGAVDAITSRITHRLWAANQRYWFFIVVGLDQAIHMTCLYLTMGLL